MFQSSYAIQLKVAEILALWQALAPMVMLKSFGSGEPKLMKKK